MKIQGSVAIVTGGAQGIGKHICRALLSRGGKVSVAAASCCLELFTLWNNLYAQICTWIVSHASARGLKNYFDIACKLKFSIDANRLVYFPGFLSPLYFATGRFPPGGGGGAGGRPYKSPWRIQGRGPCPLRSYQTEAQRTEKHFFETRTPPYLTVWMNGLPPDLKVWSGSIAKSDRDAHRKIKIKSLRETNVDGAFEPREDKAKTDVTTFFITFFMCSPKQYLNGQIYWLSLPTTLCETKICNLHP